MIAFLIIKRQVYSNDQRNFYFIHIIQLTFCFSIIICFNWMIRNLLGFIMIEVEEIQIKKLSFVLKIFKSLSFNYEASMI
jgi:hypothetical protein